MALLKAFVCQVVLFGLYKLFLEEVVEAHLVPDELTRNCIVGFVCLVCFGIQLYTEKVEDQARQAEASKAKSRRRSPPDLAESVSEFLDARTAHMMRTLDAAMQQMNQMPMSDAYVQNVVFAAAGPTATVIEQTYVKQPDVVLVEEVYETKLNDVVNASEPIPIPVKIEEVKNEKEVEEEEVEEEESETKSDVCEEEEEDVVTVIDASKSKPEVEKAKPVEAVEAESEEEEEEESEEEEEEEPVVVVLKKKVEEKPSKEPPKKEVVVEEEEEEEQEDDDDEEEEEEQDEVKQDAGKATKKS